MKPKGFSEKLRFVKETISNLDSKEMIFIHGGEFSVIDTRPCLCRTETDCAGCDTFNARVCESHIGWC